jgi:hypothetical protein
MRLSVRFALLALALACFAVIMIVHLQTPPLVLNDSRGGATVQVVADRNRLVVPGECLHLTWQAEGIQAIFLNDAPTVGSGDRELCAPANPALRVVFQDGSEQQYPVAVERVYRTVPGALVLVAGVLLAAAAAWALVGPRAALVLLVVALLAPLARINTNMGMDYTGHLRIAARVLEDASALPPHFLYHVLILGLAGLFPTLLNLETASFLVIVAMHVLTGLAVYALLGLLDDQPGPRRRLLHVLVTLGLLLVTPISFTVGALDPFHYSAYIYPNPYHNPTIIVLQPSAVLLFLLAVRAFARQQTGAWTGAGLALVVVLGTLAKPSYTMAFVPAIALAAGWRFLGERAAFQGMRARLTEFIRRYGVALGAIFIPAALVLGWQYWFLYGASHASTVYAAPAHLSFAPLYLLRQEWALSWGEIIPQVAASLVFPAAVYAIYARSAWKDWPLNLAWLVFLIGFSYTVLLVELPNAEAGNMTWSARIALFVLFAASAGFWLRQRRLGWRFAICGVLFGLHLVYPLLSVRGY